MDDQNQRQVDMLESIYPMAASMWSHLFQCIEDEGLDVIVATREVANSLDSRDLAALYVFMRTWFRPDRMYPDTVDQWLIAYAVIQDMVDPDAARERGWIPM